MGDVLTPEQRRKNMQHICSQNTKIEVILRKALWKRGYRYRKNYKELLGKPDIVLIKLGTNDTKPQNWKYKDEFMADYQHLIDSYKALNSHPRIILLTPIRCFLPEGSSINAALIENLL